MQRYVKPALIYVNARVDCVDECRKDNRVFQGCPDIDVTDEFKRVQIRPFEEYMDSVLGETSSEITDLSDYIS